MKPPVIMCRVRPPLHQEERVVFAQPDTSSIIIPPGEEYHYSRVFGETAGESDVLCGIQEHLNINKDCTIMTYGCTSSGKTTTLMGILAHITDILPTEGAIEFTAMEIYNGKTTKLVSTRSIGPQDANVYIRQALSKRSTGSTTANSQSSRSHLFISFRFVQKNSVLTFIDLAGSERMTQTGDDPSRKQEAIHVNKSLSALRDVVECIATGKSYIPWRNSTLTQQIRQVLRSPDSILLIILCLNHQKQQALDTLRFGRKATRMNKCQIPKSSPPPPEAVQDEESEEERKYKEAYEELSKELETVKQKLANSRKRPRCSECGEEGHNKRTCTGKRSVMTSTEF